MMNVIAAFLVGMTDPIRWILVGIIMWAMLGTNKPLTSNRIVAIVIAAILATGAVEIMLHFMQMARVTQIDRILMMLLPTVAQAWIVSRFYKAKPKLLTSESQ